ncbi:MAG: COG1361 family protein, partial [Candidatus Syntropharchaeales archaeon]
MCLNPTSAYDEDDLEWACGNSKVLHLGETISNGNYIVEAYNFPRSDRNETQFVGIRLYKDGVLVSDQTLVEGEDYIYISEIRITALEFSASPSDWTDLPEERWAKIKMEPIGVPRFDVEFETDKDDYSAYSAPIEVDLVIQNTGDAEAHNVDIHIDPGGLEVIGGKTHHHRHNLEKGRRVDGDTDTPALDPITLRLDVPSVIEDTVFNITVKIECYDIRGVKYSYSESYPVKVSGMFRISKSINDNIYINEVATVTVTLRNDGTRSINSINVSDTLPPDFKLGGNSTLQWELGLGAGECRSFTYTLTPMQPNEAGYVIPAAVAEWTEGDRTYSVRSNSPSIAVYGPKIGLSKTVSSISEDGTVTVTIEVNNTG